MKTVTFFNNKGGVGKTTTIVNLAAFLSKRRGKRMVILDLDPQSNSTQAILSQDRWIELYGEDPKTVTIFNYFDSFMQGDSTFHFFPVPISANENNFMVSLIPGHLNMSLVDDVMSQSWQTLTYPGGLRKQNWLNQLKANLENDYDYLFIDVGPSLGPLNRSALLNSDYFFTPMASDIFSLLGVKNIRNWITNWAHEYYTAVETSFPSSTRYTEGFYEKELINSSREDLVRFVGYSIQQYTTRKFKSGVRVTKSYEKVVNEFPKAIIEYLGEFKADNLSDDMLMLGDIPYAYSVIPLSQVSNMPIFDLTYDTGIRGGQSASVEDYTRYISDIADRFLRNVGDVDGEYSV